MYTQTSETQRSITPKKALQLLVEGNARFRKNLREHRNLLEQVNETRDGQYPFATVLSCIDSRTSAELIFDQGLGDIFSIRLAGNVVNDDVLGSMEFACQVAGSRLLVVLGHTECGAIKGACDGVQLGNLSALLAKIQPSVYCERQTREERNSKNRRFVQNVTALHVRRSLEAVIERSEVLRNMVQNGQVGAVGGVYDVATGEVAFLEDTFMFGAVKHFFLDLDRAQRGAA